MPQVTQPIKNAKPWKAGTLGGALGHTGAPRLVGAEAMRGAKGRRALSVFHCRSLFLLVICLATISINIYGQTKPINNCVWPSHFMLDEDTSTANRVVMGKMEFNPRGNMLSNPDYFNLSYIDTSNHSFFLMKNRNNGTSIYSNTDIVHVLKYSHGSVKQIIIQNWPSCVVEEVWFDTLGNVGSTYHCNYSAIGDCYKNTYENGKLEYVEYYVPISMLPSDSIPPESLINEFRAVGVKSGYYDDNGVLHYR